MINFNLFTKVSIYLTLSISMLAGAFAQAQIIGPSVTEVKFSYEARFTIPADAYESDDQERAELHASHMFGLFHSPTIMKKYKLPSYVEGGIGAPRSQMQIKILSSVHQGDKIAVHYKNSGKIVFHAKAAAIILAKGYIDLPMPTDVYDIYDEKCTDEHYTTFSDFWYFYDPFREGCEYLSRKPKSAMVRIAVSPTTHKKMDLTPKLPILRGDNKNGSLFLIYAIHGYESSRARNDSGRLNYDEFNEYLLSRGFVENKIRPRSTNALNIYTKQIALENGKVLDVEVRHLLTQTDSESRSTVFANFFKEAVDNADVILYGGHSGLGSNLDLDTLQAKAGAFNFNKDKKQLFFFDSCSSYSYYLEHFAVEKTKAKIDIISYGLSSYFHTSNAVWSTLMDYLISPSTKDVEWKTILHDMEMVLEGDSYLLNVGGI